MGQCSILFYEKFSSKIRTNDSHYNALCTIGFWNYGKFLEIQDQFKLEKRFRIMKKPKEAIRLSVHSNLWKWYQFPVLKSFPALAIAFSWSICLDYILIVSLVLFLFENIWRGRRCFGLLRRSYNALLNTTSKFCSFLCRYLDIACSLYGYKLPISAMGYVITYTTWSSQFLIIIATIILNWLFLVHWPIGAGVRICQSSHWYFHFSIWLLFLILSGLFSFFLLTSGVEYLLKNWNFQRLEELFRIAIFLGFAASMLGVSGFESFPGKLCGGTAKKVFFQKTLKYMWMVVSVINPLPPFSRCIFANALLQKWSISKHAFKSKMASQVGGNWLAIFNWNECFLVLSGAVLTKLCRGIQVIRKDGFGPGVITQFLFKEQTREVPTESSYFSSMLTILFVDNDGDVKTIGRVYTISFCRWWRFSEYGNILLKKWDKQIASTRKSSWLAIFIAIVASWLLPWRENVLMKTCRRRTK